MKKRIKVKNLIIILLLLAGTVLVTSGFLWCHYTGRVSKNSEKVVVSVEGSGTQIGKILEENNLIKSASFFKLYFNLMES